MMKDVNLDVDRFIKDMESVMKREGFHNDGSDVELEEGSSSDMDFGNFLDYFIISYHEKEPTSVTLCSLNRSSVFVIIRSFVASLVEDHPEDEDIKEENEDGIDPFMHSYSDAPNKELKATTLGRSFVRANDQPLKKASVYFNLLHTSFYSFSTFPFLILALGYGTSNATEDMDEDFTPVDVDVNLVKNLLDSFSSQEELTGNDFLLLLCSVLFSSWVLILHFRNCKSNGFSDEARIFCRDVSSALL
ncbi:hypothetical protein M9H77_18691 [Catharanthus roseus]|uniref:Uncharacterized protein n=1 Tax=Catharanthus roseus TaxID=4058 RepID=A0ACC0B882_CATRO|nr:hypothetical protein M9H77_18691 [Catharanthus roseus]